MQHAVFGGRFRAKSGIAIQASVFASIIRSNINAFNAESGAAIKPIIFKIKKGLPSLLAGTRMT